MLSHAVTRRNNERGQERSGTARNQIRTDSQDMPAALTDKAGAGIRGDIPGVQGHRKKSRGVP
jgi:hypothetical protein